MDPTATLLIIRDAGVALADRLDALANLAQWIQLGGFQPAGLDGTRVLSFSITIATLCGQYDLKTDRWPRHVVEDLLERI